MFQNDLSFVKKDFDKEEIDISNLSNLIKELMEEHEECSVAAPFFYSWELNDLKDQLPSTWSLEIDGSTKVPANKIRFTIANAYFEAERYFETEEFDNVKLKGESIGRIDIADDEDEEIIVLTCEMPFSEESEMTLLELDCASGESPYKLSITAGQNFGGNCKTFACPGEFVESGNFETGNISEIEEFLKKIMSLYQQLSRYSKEELKQIYEDAFVKIKEVCLTLKEQTKCSNSVVLKMLNRVTEYNEIIEQQIVVSAKEDDEDALVNIKEVCLTLQEQTKCSNDVLSNLLNRVSLDYY